MRSTCRRWETIRSLCIETSGLSLTEITMTTSLLQFHRTKYVAQLAVAGVTIISAALYPTDAHACSTNPVSGGAVTGTAVAGTTCDSTNYGVEGINQGSTGGIGVYGTASGPGDGVLGANSNAGSYGVEGRNWVSSGTGAGVAGSSESPSGYGVYGSNTSTTIGYGVFGKSSSSNGYGVYGSSPYTGVGGSTTGGGAGVAGGCGTTGIGVQGNAGAQGTGVYGATTSTNTSGAGVEGVCGATSGCYGGVFYGDIYLTGTQKGPSDMRLKKDVKPLEGALDTMLRLKGVTFEWNERANRPNSGTQYGFIAQDVEKVFPSWVGTAPDGFKTLSVQQIEALEVESIRTLKTENDELRKHVEALENGRRPVVSALGANGAGLGIAGFAIAGAVVISRRKRDQEPLP